MDDNKAKALYNGLSKVYNNLGTYDEFAQKLSDETSRVKLFQQASQQFKNLGTWDEFNTKLGFSTALNQVRNENTADTISTMPNAGLSETTIAKQQALSDFDASEDGQWMSQYERDRKEFTSQFKGQPSQLTADQRLKAQYFTENNKRYRELSHQRSQLESDFYNDDEFVAWREGKAKDIRAKVTQDKMDQSGASKEGKPIYDKNGFLVEGKQIKPVTPPQYFGNNTKGSREQSMAEKLLLDAADIYDAPSKYDNDRTGFANYFKGMGNQLTNEDFWTRGLTEIGRNMELRSIQQKLQKGLDALENPTLDDIDKILNKDEKDLLLAYWTYMDAQQIRSADMSIGYKAGQSSIESLGFMAEFMATGAVRGAIGKAMSKSTSAAAQWLSRELGVSVLDTTAEGAALMAARTAGMSKAGDFIYKYVGKPMMQAATHTILQPGMYRTISQEMIKTNSAGELQSLGESVINGVLDAYIEYWSEMMGGAVEGILSSPFKGLKWAGEKLGVGGIKLGKVQISDIARWASESGVYKMMRENGFNGFIGEIGEEYVGAAARLLTGLMTGDEFKEQMWSKEGVAELAASFGLLTALGLGGNAVSAIRFRNEFNTSRDKMRDILSRNGVSEEEINNLFDRPFATTKDIAKAYAPYFEMIAQNAQNDASLQAKNDLNEAINFVRLAGQDTINKELDAIVQQRKRDDKLAQINSEMKDKQFWMDGENGQQIRRITTQDGKVGYIVGGNESNWSVAYTDGSVGFITEEAIKHGAETGTMQDTGFKSENDFYDFAIEEDRAQAESTRMQSEQAVNDENLKQTLQPGAEINIGTTEAPVMATIEATNGDGIIVNTSEGYKQYTWQEASQFAGIDTTVQTDAQQDEQAAKAQQELEDIRKTIDAASKNGLIVTHDGQRYNLMAAVEWVKDEQTGEDRLRCYTTNALGQSINIELTKDEVATAMSSVEVAQEQVSNTENITPESPVSQTGEAGAAQEEKMQDSPAPAGETKLTPAEQTKMWNENPEEWARYNDKTKGEENTKTYIGAALAKIDKDIAAIDKAYASELDFAKRDAMEQQKADLEKRRAELQGVLSSYDLRDQQRKQAEEDAKAQAEAQKAYFEEKEKKQQEQTQTTEQKPVTAETTTTETKPAEEIKPAEEKKPSVKNPESLEEAEKELAKKAEKERRVKQVTEATQREIERVKGLSAGQQALEGTGLTKKSKSHLETRDGKKVRIYEHTDDTLQAMRTAAEQMIPEGSGISVKVYNSWSDIKDDDPAKSVAHDDTDAFTRNGAVYINLSLIDSLDKMKTKVIHEAVAHIGMKRLLGQQAFDSLCDMVWDMMSDRAKAWLENDSKDGGKGYRKRYAGILSKDGEQAYHRAIADEYIAYLSEQTDMGVQTEERTILEKVIDFIRNLFGLKVDDEFIQDLLRKSWANIVDNGQTAQEESIVDVAHRLATRKNRASVADTDTRLSSNIDASEDDFHKMIDELLTNPTFDKTPYLRQRYNLGETPYALKAIGLKGDEFSLSFKTIKEHINKDADHNLTIEEWHNLPAAIKEPFLVTKYGLTPGEYRLYLSMTINGKTAVVGIDVIKVNKGKDNVVDINKIKTTFGKNEDSIGRNETIVAYDEKITPEQEALLREHNYREYPTIQELSESKGTTNSGKTNNYDENNKYSVVTPERSYVTKKAINAADKANGGDIRFSTAYHGSAEIFDRFDGSHFLEGEGSMVYGAGHYVSNNMETGMMYANIATEKKQLSQSPIVYWKGTRVDFSDANPLRMAYDLANDCRTISEARQRAERYIELAEDQEMKDKWSSALDYLKQSTKADFKPEPVRGNRQLYEVEIPDDNGRNYIQWNGHNVTDQQLDMVGAAITDEQACNLLIDMSWDDEEEVQTPNPAYSKAGWEKVLNKTMKFDESQKSAIFRQWFREIRNYKNDGLDLYSACEQFAEGKEYGKEDIAISAFLSKAGFTGIKVPTGYRQGGDGRGMNYVIFKDDDLKITNRTRFSTAIEDSDPFYSNAAHALEGIRQNKATAQQWIAMLQKAGGLKAEEDKWLGLSDWLNAQEGSIEKAAIEQYMADNAIKVEDVWYASNAYEYDYSFKEEWVFSNYLGSPDIQDAILDQTKFENGKFVWRDGYNASESEIRALEELNSDVKSDRPINATRLTYTTDGLKNKREIAMTVPTIEPYNQSDNIHFGDAGEGRAVAWVRFGDAKSISQEQHEWIRNGRNNGEPHPEHTHDSILVIDEIQSKRHQDGREKGYKKTEPENIDNYEGRIFKDYDGEDVWIIKDKTTGREYKVGPSKNLEEAVLKHQNYSSDLTPDAPFRKNWHELAMKRMLRLAAEEGYDKIAWTNGAMQAERYDLTKVIDEIAYWIEPKEYWKNGEKTWGISAGDARNSQKIDAESFTSKELDEMFGREIADKIRNDEGVKETVLGYPEDEDVKYLNGETLSIGGEGMKGFYDKILVDFMNKYGKKWGVKVQDMTIPGLQNKEGWHSIDVTPEMRESVMNGQPMFSVTSEMDEEYRKAYENGNEAKATSLLEKAFMRKFPNNKLVDDYGRPLLLLHGTKEFGFTKIDKNKLGDLLSFFTTSNLTDVAQSYSGSSEEKRIGAKHERKDVGDALSAVEYIADIISNHYPSIDKYWLCDYVMSHFAHDIGDDGLVKEIEFLQQELINTIGDDYDENKHGSKKAFLAMFEGLLEELADTAVKYNEVALDSHGNYALYGNMENPLVVDAEANDWLNIPFNGGKVDTRYLSVYAKDKGYDGLVIKNVIDLGDEAVGDEIGDVYVFHNFSNLKSADAFTFDDDNKLIPLSERFNEQNPDIRYSVAENEEDQVRYSKVEDPKVLEWLNNLSEDEVATGYRTVEMTDDGSMESPMGNSLSNTGKEPVKTSSFGFQQWEQADEHPELADENGKIDLVKPDKKKVEKVDYNPYIHMRPDQVNKQFKQAWERPNLVYIRTIYPKTDLVDGKPYHADKAKKSVGVHKWNGGTLILSRYDMPQEIVPWEEVADSWMKHFGKKPIHFDIVSPHLLPILAERGANIVAPHKGMGKECIDAYNTWKEEQDRVKNEIKTSMLDVASSSVPDIRLSVTTEEDLKQQIINFADSPEAKRLGWTAQQVVEIAEETSDLVNALHAALADDPNYDEFAKKRPTLRVDWRDGIERPIVTWVRNNIEYKYDMSADTFCINNEGIENILSDPTMIDLMAHITDYARKKAKKSKDEEFVGFNPDDYMRLYKVLNDLGIVVSCKGCFDAAARFKMLPSVAQKFVHLVNSVIDERNQDPEKFDAEVKSMKGKKTETGYPAGASTKEVAVRVGVAGDKLTEHISWMQLMSAKGQTQALTDWGGIFRAWQHTGAGRPKDKLMPEPYTGQIMTTVATIIAPYGETTPSFRDLEVNVGTGLRRNSHSEFRPTLAVDEMQFVRDAWLKHLCVFKYMKELDDVRLFGEMGIKFNMSAFAAWDENGPAAGLLPDGSYAIANESVGGREYPYTDDQGNQRYDGYKGLEEAKKHINKDCSLSLVVFSIPHFIKALTDVPTPSDKRGLWGSLIPFHASGATAKQLREQGLGLARAIKSGTFAEALSQWNKGVTNFEDVQNDRYGDDYIVIDGKDKGKSAAGHKMEYPDAKVLRNGRLGVTLYRSIYAYRGMELDEDVVSKVELNKKGEPIIDKETGKEKRKALVSGQFYTLDSEDNKIAHPLAIDYNDKVRELGGKYAYKEAADFYIDQLRSIGIMPRFDFEVPEDVFLKACADAKIDPRHPKLGWKGEGHSWTPADAESYYSVWCDYGMTDPATGELSGHRPVLEGQTAPDAFEKALPKNYKEIIKEGLTRYTERRTSEDAKTAEVIKEYVKRSIEEGRMDEKTARDILKEYGIRYSTVSAEDESAFQQAYEQGDADKAIELLKKVFKAKYPKTEIKDSKGDPMIVFHGTPEQFNEFHSGYGQYGYGVYFTTDKRIAEEYGDNIMPVFVNLEKMADYNDAEEIVGVVPEELYGTEDDLTAFEYHPETLDMLEDAGFDGFIDDGNSGFVLWNPEGNIKSAEPFTFDDKGNLIPLSERFDKQDNDIRYSSAYHGSPAEFDAFDNTHIGEGQGAQAHGYGTYVALNPDISRRYAESIGDERRFIVKYNGMDAQAFRDEYNRLLDEKDADGLMKLDTVHEFIRRYREDGADFNGQRNFMLWHNSLAIRGSERAIADNTRLAENTTSDKQRTKYNKAIERNKALLEREKKRREILFALTPEDFEYNRPAFLYDVEIPDDNGDNYIHEDKPLPERAAKAFREEYVKTYGEDAAKEEWDDNLAKAPYWSVRETLTGRDNAAEKALSELLSSLGYVGIKYDGSQDGQCAVIFNDKDIDINNKTRFSATPEVRQVRNLRKDLYRSILDNGFDDVTLQKIDSYLEGAYEGQYKISERLPDSWGRGSRKRDRVLGATLLLSRLAEAAVSRDEKSQALTAKKKVDQATQSLLEEWAKATNNWYNIDRVAELVETMDDPAYGSDSRVYPDKDGEHVIKISHNKPDKMRFAPDRDQIAIFNDVFPNVAYELLGFGRDEEGKFFYVTRQQAISGRQATQNEIQAYMESKGFKQRKKNFDTFYNDDYIISDLKWGNVLVTPEGSVAVIDADCLYNTTATGGKRAVPDINTEFTGEYTRRSATNPENSDRLSTVTPEIDEEVSVSRRLPIGGTYFSGGGFVEWALRGVIDPQLAAEYKKKIRGVYADNHGNHIMLDDVQKVDYLKIWELVYSIGHLDYFHFSPVCKRASTANVTNRGEAEIDKVTAEAALKLIRVFTPPVVTMENVAGYQNFEAFKSIVSTLKFLGYDVDYKVYDASNYGAATDRKRLILRAVKDRTLPPIPAETRDGEGWYERIKSLIPGMPVAIMTDRMIGRLSGRKINGKAWNEQDKPIAISMLGQSPVLRNMDDPFPTITAAKGDGEYVIMPGGEVRAMTPRALARLMGVSDDYKLPKSNTLAHTIIGNGVPVELTRGVIAPLINTVLRDVHEKRKVSLRIAEKYNELAEQYMTDFSRRSEIEDKLRKLFNKYVLSQADESITPILFANRYKENNSHNVAHAIKGETRKVGGRPLGQQEAVRIAASEMAMMVPENSVLIPIPSHTGIATDTKILAEEISRLTGAPVVDALDGFARKSNYEKKKATGKGFRPEELGFRQIAKVPEDKQIIFIDNVVATGATAAAATRAMGGGITLAYAYSGEIAFNGRGEGNTNLIKSAELVTYGDDGRIIPLEERFNPAKQDIRYSATSDDYSSYTSEDGSEIKYVSLLNNEKKEIHNSGRRADDTANGEDKVRFSSAEDPTKIKLRKLKPGEFCSVERQYTKSKAFSFVSGKNRVESIDDVAFIFKSLQDYAVENAFVALVKDGKPTIIHVGMGGFSSAPVDIRTILPAVSKIDPDEIYLVHNHPSGSITASKQDSELLYSLRRAYGNRVKSGIIIDTFTGEYGVFEPYNTTSSAQIPDMDDAVKLPVYTFDKQKYITNEVPTKVKSSLEVAEFISTQRLGVRGKLSALIVNQGGYIIGNIHLSFTELKSNTDAIANEICSHVVHMGGTCAIVYGNNISIDSASELKMKMRAKEIALLDAVNIRQDIPGFPYSKYDSAADKGMLESNPVYQANIRYSAIGEIGMSNIGDEVALADLATAKDMLAKGNDAMTIKLATGWEQGVDGKWRHEFPDADFKDGAFERRWGNNTTIGDIVNAPELFAAYPQMKDIKVKRLTSKTGAGAYVRDDNLITINTGNYTFWSKVIDEGRYEDEEDKQKMLGWMQMFVKRARMTLIHELQHAIQYYEGFARGGSSTEISDHQLLAKADLIRNEGNALIRKYNDMSVSEKYSPAGYRLRSEILQKKSEYANLVKSSQLGLDGYKRLAGEVEARNIEKRFDLTEEQRRNTLMSMTEDVARDFQIIKYSVVASDMADDIYSRGLRGVADPKATRKTWQSIYRDLSEDIRKKVTDSMDRYNWSSSRATESFFASLAENADMSNMSEEGKQMWSDVRDALQDLLGIPLGINDAMWMTWNDVHSTDKSIQSEVRRAKLSHELGFSEPYKEIRRLALEMMQDEEMDDIRYSIAGDEIAEMYNLAVGNVWNRQDEVLRDQYASVNAFYDAYESKTSKAKSFEDARLALNQRSSRGAEMLNTWRRNHWNPMMNAVRAITKALRIGMRDVEEYVMLKHILERNEVMAKNDARKFYKDEFERRSKEVSESKTKSDEQKLRDIAAYHEIYDQRMRDIDAGTDVKYLEFREKDYGGILGMFTDYSKVPGRRAGESQESYQQRLKDGGAMQFNTVADAEVWATALVNSFESRAGSILVENLWNQINGATKATLYQQYKSNMISRSQYESARDMYKYYVPLRGFDQATPQDLYTYYTKGADNGFQSPLKQAHGRTSKAGSPFGYIGSMASSGVMSAAKNESKLALYYFLSNRREASELAQVSDAWYEMAAKPDDNGNPVFRPVFPRFLDTMSEDDVHEAYEAWLRDMEMKRDLGIAYHGIKDIKKQHLSYTVNTDQAVLPSHMIEVMVAGERKQIFINGNPRVAQAINGELNMESNQTEVGQMLSAVLRYFAQVNTGLNPEFWISNLQRDWLFSSMSVDAKENAEYKKLFRQIRYGDALKVAKMRRAYENGTLGDSEAEQYYREFVENGGVTGYTTQIKNEEWERELIKFSETDRNALELTWDALKAISDFGESIEQMTRFTAYMASRKSGKDIIQSVADAKELTVNFNRKGSGKAITFAEAKKLVGRNGKPLNGVEQFMHVMLSSISYYGRRFVMFYNAAVQGINAMYQLYKANPKKMWLKWTTGLMTMGAMNALIHAMIDNMGDDDDDEYLDIPDYERRNNLLLGHKGVYLKWALPQEARMFYAMGDLVVNEVLGRMPHKSATEEILSMIGSLSPIDPTEGLMGMMPSTTTPLLNILVNEDYKGSRVYNDRKYATKWDKENGPKWASPLPYPSKFYVGLTKALSFVTGGNTYEGGYINLDPDILQHLVESYTGGLGTTVTKLFKFASNTAHGKFVLNQTPFARRLAVNNDDRTRNAYITELWYYYQDKVDEVETKMSKAKSNRDREYYNSLRDTYEYAVKEIMDRNKGKVEMLDRKLKAEADQEKRKAIMREQDALRRQILNEISNIKNKKK